MNKLQIKLQKLENKLQILAKLRASRSTLLKIVEQIFKIENLLELVNKAKTKILELKTGRKQWRAWVAKIYAKRDKIHGGYSKEFIEPKTREFDKKGEISVTFEIKIDLHQIYQDSYGDFWMFENNEGDIKVISYQEVKYRFDQIPF